MAIVQTIRTTILVLAMSLQLALTECPGESPCKSSSGIFPVPGDCSSFFNCAHCRAYQQQCAPGTLFDPVLRVCNHANKVQCGQSTGNVDFSGSQFVARSGRLDERRTYPTQRPPFNPQPAAAALPVYPQQPYGQIPPQKETGSGIKQSDNIFSERSYGSTPKDHLSQTGHVSSAPEQYHSQDDLHKLKEQDAERQPGRRTPIHGRTRFPPITSQGPLEETIQSGQTPAGTQKAPTQHGVSSRTRVISLPAESNHQDAEDKSSGSTLSAPLRKETFDERPTNEDERSQTQGTAEQAGRVQTTPADATGRRRYDHSHLSHHPEAVAYVSTHEIVFDHSHNTHHLHHDDEQNDRNVQRPNHQFTPPPPPSRHSSEPDAVSEQMQPSRYHGNPELPEYSRNNRGYMPPTNSRSQEQEPDKKSLGEATPPTTSHAVPQTTFDLKNREQPSSGYVPSFVQSEMADDEVPRRKSHDYGERIFVRRPNTSNRQQETPRAGIVDMKGQPVEPERFYVDEEDTVGSFGEDSDGNPTQVTEEDLRRIIANQQHQKSFVPSTESRWAPHESDAQLHRPFQSFNRQPQIRDMDRFNPVADSSGRPSYSSIPKEEAPSEGLSVAASVTSSVNIPQAH